MEHMRSRNDATRSQNDILFSLGNAMSGAPIMSGTIQLPNPPIIAGITMKKIMMIAWLLKNTLYMFLAASGEPSPDIIAEIQRENVHSRRHQFGPDHDRKHGADQASENREDEIERPDILVIGGIEVSPPSGREVVIVLVMSLNAVMAKVGDGRHG